jgi:penicillin amidase
MFGLMLARIGLLASELTRRILGHPRRVRTTAGVLAFPGLEKEVWICRDDAGVPQIYAETLGDLAFGMGVAMAQDRLWQMDLLRRLAGGRLAEIMGNRPIGGGSLHLFGPTALAMDKFYRGLRIYAMARQERSLLSDDGATIVEGFAKGVNAWGSRIRARDLPPEFLLAGFRPEPWTPEDSFAIGKLIGWLLELAYPVKPILAALASDPDLRAMLPPNLADGVCILGDGLPTEPASLELLARQALGLSGPGMGSNSWVVSGRLSASGKPLLCNDPHLLLGLPSIWYPVALHGPRHRVIGGTMPGIPAVLAGRNEHLAWGLTAVMADDGDYYRETLDGSGTRYLRGGQWHAVEIVEEQFQVRGQLGTARVPLRFVRHGGVPCPLLSQEDGAPPFSFRWAGLEPWRGLEAFLGMNRARSTAEFEDAVRDLAVPAQNVVVADTEGTIAYFCAGKFPRRAWRDVAPVILDGASAEHEWQGYLAWDELPRAVNPPEGFLVTANNRVARDLPFTIARSFWEPPYRATRIAQLLRQCGNAGVKDMARIQTDVLSLQAAGTLARLVRPVAQDLGDPRARQAASLLLAWDCRLTEDSAAAALYHLFYQELLQSCFRSRLERRAPGVYTGYFSLLHLAVPAADTALLAPDGTWFPEGVGAGVEKCLVEAWGQAVARLGPNPAAWQWGSLHTLTFRHSLGRSQHWAFRALVWLLQLDRGPYARPGDGMTVNLGAFPLTQPFGVVVGPSYRQIVDLGDPQNSCWIVAGGTSGDPRSPHYADQIEPWLRGEYRPMRLRSRGEADGGSVLRLVPAGAAGERQA